MIDRIEKILRNKGLSHSHFADEIGVQRSSVSHVMSGRNKPSLDFVRSGVGVCLPGGKHHVLLQRRRSRGPGFDRECG
ncbi:MAG: helix-turn-helix transcriptional regulator, partial [Bacteroidales bacterium]